MKAKGQFGILLIALASVSTSGVSATKYPNLKTETRTILTAQNLLKSDCVNIGAIFKKCTIVEEVSASDNLDQIAIPYRSSKATGILVEGSFQNTGGNFELVIDGIAYEIRDDGSRSIFNLPLSTSNKITLKVTSKKHGLQTMTKNFKAEITAVKLVLSNDSYIANILADLPDLKSTAEEAKSNHAREKKLNGFLKKTPEEIKSLKSLLTGRDPDDFGDCEKTQDGIEDLLDPETCQIFRVCNDILLGRPTEVTDDTVASSLTSLDRAVTAFSDAITVLTENQTVLDIKYQNSVAALLKYLQGEKPLAK